jgi:peptide/nickel transport system substrate-binding protein
MTTNVSAERAVRLLVVLAMLTACAARDTRDPTTLVAAISSDPGQLNPAITTNGSVHTAASLLYDGLVTLGEDLVPRPALALRWEVLDSGARYRFHLRRGVRWHDGQPFTASDVAFTFQELLLKYHARTRASLGSVLRAVTAIDDSTVEFHFKRPYAPLLQQLDVVEAPIAPRHIYEGSDPLRNRANVAPVGTGPFRFQSYQMDREIRLARNGEYFGGAPKLEHLVLRVIPDGGTAVLALERGEVDWLFDVPGPERARLRRDPRFRFVTTAMNPGGSNCITTLGFNLDRPVFRDVRVRRAIAHGIDKQQLLERVAFGEGRVADAPISSRIGFAHATGGALPIAAFDTVAAARLLDAAHVQRPLVLSLKVQPGFVALGNLLRAQLRRVGVDLRVQTLEQSVYGDVVFNKRDFDTSVASYCNGTDPEIGARRMYVASSIGPVAFSNMAGYRNAEVDRLFDGASAELNTEKRGALYRRIQEIVVRDQPYVWLLESVSSRVHSARCSGFGSSAHFAATAECSH